MSLHVDIRNDKKTPDIVVEVSNDGAPWHELARFPLTIGAPDTRDRDARAFAAAWMDGARYAGATVRATAFGYAA